MYMLGPIWDRYVSHTRCLYFSALLWNRQSLSSIALGGCEADTL